MEFRDVVRRRRMVRNYRPDPVDPEALERVLEAARRAPSAGFSQGQSLVVVTDPESRRRIAALAGEDEYVQRGFNPWMSRAPVHLVLCTREEDYHERYREPDKVQADGSEIDWPVPYWHVDAGCTLMLVLLAAVDEGLAAGFFGAHRLAGLKDLLDIPADVTVLGVITLGHPTPDRPSASLKRGRKPGVVHRERWGATAPPRPQEPPAPPAGDWLRREVARFDPSLPLERAWMPPSSWFLDPRFLDLERETTFRRSWIPVGRLDQVEGPGDYFTGTFLGEPYLVTRDEGGTLRAFANACRHHAARVAEGEGCAERFVCPYHGWTYRLDGRLQRAPGLGRVEGFDREAFGLHPLPVEAWGPFVFLHLGQPTHSLQDDLRPLHDLMEPTGYRDLRFHGRRSWEIACNWKVYVDNYLDGGYHVSHLHRGLASQLDLATYRTDLFARFSVQSCGAGEGPAEGSDFAERVAGGAVYAWLHPVFMINRYGPVMDTNLVIPLAPDRTLTVFDYYFEEGADPEFIQRSLVASEQVQVEDVGICESVQQGLGSCGYERGRYAAPEAPDLHFHRLLAEDYRASLRVSAQMSR